MAEYLLDSNHASPLVTLGHPLRDKILAQLQTGDVFAIATPVLHEVLFGISLLPRVQDNLKEWSRLQSFFKYYAIDEIIARQSAELRVMLRRKGRQLEVIDSFIAVTALQNNLVLLTTDKDFQAVPNLVINNWR